MVKQATDSVYDLLSDTPPHPGPRRYVYLAGPIAGCSFKEATDWREAVAADFLPGPVRGKAEGQSHEPVLNDGVGNGLHGLLVGGEARLLVESLVRRD